MVTIDKVESACCAGHVSMEHDAPERRQQKRIDVEHIGIDCDMQSASRVKVKNISSSGVLVMADRLINIGRSYALKIGYKDKSVVVKAIAVWALLADCLKQDNGDVIPLYLAGMQFVDVIRGEMSEMISILEAQACGSIHDAFLGSPQGNAYN